MAAQNLTKHPYSAVSPDGSTVTRITTRAYAFVVFARFQNGHYEGQGVNYVLDGTFYWSDAHWVGSMALAQKAAQKYSQVEIVPVNNPRS